MLFEIEATDPLSAAAVAAVLGATALAASYVPALRAGRLDPADVLRAE